MSAPIPPVQLFMYEPPPPPSASEAAVLLAQLRDQLAADRLDAMANLRIARLSSRWDFDLVDGALVLAISMLVSGDS